MSKAPRSGLLASSLFAALLGLSACPEGASESLPGGSILGSDCDEDSFRDSILAFEHVKSVDILFVIDDSAGMAAAQAKLAASVDPLFEVLDALDANYRIGFTTTDIGNPWCPPELSTPEAGALVLGSCRERLDDFVLDAGEDARALACADLCTLDAGELAVAPTTTDFDDSAAPRPWLEYIEGVSNLPEATDLVEAFRCLAPQGIGGCGFEAPLESMFRALNRAMDEQDESYGFMRADAILAVVLISDEADCSYAQAWAEIFDADGPRVFWSDPAAPAPSSALCWNAGVSCSGDPSAYDSCEPANKTSEGGDATSLADAVLHPTSRYVLQLNTLEQQKQELSADRDVLVELIGGVEGGGASWSVSYAEASDPDYGLEFGVGPGCTGADGLSAVPPVRMRAVVEAMDPEGLYSICEADYTQAMADLGARIEAQFPSPCYSQCIADADLSTPQLEPECRVEQDPPGNSNTEDLVECEREADGRYRIDPDTQTYALPAGVDVCYVTRTDADGSQTLDPNDDLSAECADLNYNLEVELVRRRGVPAPAGTSIVVTCTISACPELSCPGIGG